MKSVNDLVWKYSSWHFRLRWILTRAWWAFLDKLPTHKEFTDPINNVERRKRAR